MANTNEIKHFTDEQVLSSQPSLVNAMQLVRANALESGASADRMFLKVSQGSLAGLDLLWDQPSLSWVVKAGCVVAPDPDRMLRDYAQQLVDVLGGSFTWVMGTEGDGYVVTLPNGKVIRLVVQEASVCLCGASIPAGVSECQACAEEGGE